MDLWVREKVSDKKPVVRLYDIEPNIYEDDLPKRSRFYQAKADVKELPTGSKFRKLPQLIMIWILPYDPFGDDRMLYTVKNMVVENSELVYNDDVLKLFLYTKGKKGGSEELKSLFTYFEETTQDNAVDADLKEIQKIVGNIKHSRETEDRYMTLQEMIDHEKEDSYKAGMQQGIQGIIRTCQKLKQTKENTVETLMQECEITRGEAKQYIKSLLAGRKRNKLTISFEENDMINGAEHFIMLCAVFIYVKVAPPISPLYNKTIEKRCGGNECDSVI